MAELLQCGCEFIEGRVLVHDRATCMVCIIHCQCEDKSPDAVELYLHWQKQAARLREIIDSIKVCA